jgi:hypothetical protein
MNSEAATKAEIVDLLRYKADRVQRALNFDGPPAPPRAQLAVVRPFRPLTTREVAHRQQMVRHLAHSGR